MHQHLTSLDIPLGCQVHTDDVEPVLSPIRIGIAKQHFSKLCWRYRRHRDSHIPSDRGLKGISPEPLDPDVLRRDLGNPLDDLLVGGLKHIDPSTKGVERSRAKCISEPSLNDQVGFAHIALIDLDRDLEGLRRFDRFARDALAADVGHPQAVIDLGDPDGRLGLVAAGEPFLVQTGLGPEDSRPDGQAVIEDQRLLLGNRSIDPWPSKKHRGQNDP